MHVRRSTARVLLGLLLSSLAGLQVAHAQSQTVSRDAAFGRFMGTVTGAGQTTVSYGSSGVPLASPSTSTLATDGGANLLHTRTGRLTNPSGVDYTVTGTGRYNGAKLAPTLIKAAKVLPALGTGIAIYDLFQEVGVTANRAADGTTSFTRMQGATVPGFDGASCDQMAAAGPAGTRVYSPGLNRTYMVLYPPAAGGSSFPPGWMSDGGCVFGGWPLISGFGAGKAFIAGDARLNGPATETDVANAIASRSGWPTSSALPRAIVQAVDATGDSIAPDSVTVTGPATTTGPARTVVNADGTRQVSTPTHNHTYNTNNVTTTTTTTIQNFNSSNVLQSTSTVTETPAQQKRDCELFPQSVGCANLDTVQSDQLSKKNHAVTVSPVSFAQSAGCPSPLSFQVMGASYSVSYQPLCDRMTLLRSLFLAIAGVIAAFILANSFKV